MHVQLYNYKKLTLFKQVLGVIVIDADCFIEPAHEASRKLLALLNRAHVVYNCLLIVLYMASIKYFKCFCCKIIDLNTYFYVCLPFHSLLDDLL